MEKAKEYLRQDKKLFNEIREEIIKQETAEPKIKSGSVKEEKEEASGQIKFYNLKPLSKIKRAVFVFIF